MGVGRREGEGAKVGGLGGGARVKRESGADKIRRTVSYFKSQIRIEFHWRRKEEH